MLGSCDFGDNPAAPRTARAHASPQRPVADNPIELKILNICSLDELLPKGLIEAQCTVQLPLWLPLLFGILHKLL
jgi:hypothetical protein